MDYVFNGDCWVPEGSIAPVGGPAETVMNPSVADMEYHSPTHYATDEVNGRSALIKVFI